MSAALDLDVLARLEAVIAARRGADPDSSHTARMLSRGAIKCAEKFGEEAVETVIAGAAQDDAALTAEAADAIYHLLVLLAAREVPLSAVLAELGRREGVSGVAEKAARSDG